MNNIHITTDLAQLDQHLSLAQADIDAWFSAQTIDRPFMCSVDIRYAGYKASAIDTNLFPAGFNNLSMLDYETCTTNIQSYLQTHYPDAKTLLIIIENHTRNPYYLRNIETLKHLLQQAGLTCLVGTFDHAPKHATLDITQIRHHDHKLYANTTCPDLILLNNDYSSPPPNMLINLQQPCLPPTRLGWHQRRKSTHFSYYNKLATELGHVISLDPFYFSTLFSTCANIDFTCRQDIEQLATHSQELFTRIQHKYDALGISDPPFVVLKSNHGTYGRSILVIQSPHDLTTLNRKQRQNMSHGKGSEATKSLILQEGVRTILTPSKSHAPAEITLYGMGNHVSAGYLRHHPRKDDISNLNTPGMEFSPISLQRAPIQASPSHLLCARLAILAAGHELKNDTL